MTNMTFVLSELKSFICSHSVDSDTQRNLEELVLAADGLPTVIENIRQMLESPADVLSLAQIATIRGTLKCVICRGWYFLICLRGISFKNALQRMLKFWVHLCSRTFCFPWEQKIVYLGSEIHWLMPCSCPIRFKWSTWIYALVQKRSHFSFARRRIGPILLQSDPSDQRLSEFI